MGYCNDSVTTANQLVQFIQRADCCKIIYFGNTQTTFTRIMNVAAQNDRCSAWLKQKNHLMSLTPPRNPPDDSVACSVCKNGSHKEWLKEVGLQDNASIGMIYDECNQAC